MRIILMCLAVLCLGMDSMSQIATVIRPLSIGNTVPDIEFTNLINYPSKTARLSDFKGKVIILDFWSKTCSGCLKGIVKMNELQAQFGDKIQILLPTKDSIQSLQAFLMRSPVGKKIYADLTLPILPQSALASLFPFTIIPHVVWIDSDRIVKGITTSDYVTAANIQKLIHHQSVSDWLVKTDAMHYETEASLFQVKFQQMLVGSGKIAYSGITGFMEGVTSQAGYEEDSSKGIVRFYVINEGILRLYFTAMPDKSIRFHNNPLQRRLEVEDSTKYVFCKLPGNYKSQWKRENAYCYEAVWPIGTAKEVIKRKMKQDLDDFFGLNGRYDEKIVTGDSMRKIFVLQKQR